MADLDPPYDIEAERWLLAAMMLGTVAIDLAVDTGWHPRDCYRPAHQEIARTIINMFAAQQPVDPVTLKEAIAADGGFRGHFQPSYLAELYDLPANPLAAEQYARRVTELAADRRILELSGRMQQRAQQRGEASIAELIADYQAELDRVLGGLPEMSRPLSIADYVAQLEPEVFASLEWVIGGLLQPGERVIVGGFEGDGKSVLGLQVAVCAAAGTHPFTTAPVAPVRVLYIDLENPFRTLRRRLITAEELARRTGTWDPDRFAILHDRAGIDLRRPEGQHRLMQAIRSHKPNLIVGGPMYKMGLDDDQALSNHKAVMDFWDRVVARTGAALWLETHAPLSATRTGRVMRPFGSATWTRWPEFGIWLKETKKGSGQYDLGRFRKDRERGRSWPDMIWWRTGGIGWPWEARYPDGFFDVPLPATDVPSAADAEADELARRRAAKSPYVE